MIEAADEDGDITLDELNNNLKHVKIDMENNDVGIVEAGSESEDGGDVGASSAGLQPSSGPDHPRRCGAHGGGLQQRRRATCRRQGKKGGVGFGGASRVLSSRRRVSTRQVENIPLFPAWRAPLLVSTLLWFFLFIITWSRGSMCQHNKRGWYPSMLNGTGVFSVEYVNKTCDSHALTLLAACYLPGVLAAYIQLARGTKYPTFPGWLDRWMLMREKLGLQMLFSVFIHVCMYSFDKHSKVWYDSLFSTAGVVGFCLAVVLGITSLPSVSSSLTWREFRSVQSWLGWLCLILSSLHVVFSKWEEMFKFRSCGFPASYQLPLILPLVTVVLKLPLLMACVMGDCALMLKKVDERLAIIRRG